MRTSTAGSCKRGFTLLELIVVMVLISLSAAFVLPQIHSALSGGELRTAVRRFVGLIAETGQEARLRRTAFVLDYDRSQQLFTAAPAGEEEAGEGRTRQTLRLGSSVQVTDIAAAHSPDRADLSIRFDERGYVDKTAVHFRHDSGDELTVLLSPFLGLSKILDGHVSLDEDRVMIAR
uniref:pilus assembly FimT family protein n=1 Tax=Candidatus Electronema sp. TaxID=2698783 RepID=UPI004057243B